MDYAGIDIIIAQDGKPIIIEVNSIPAWKGLQSVCAIDLAEYLAADLTSRYLQPAPRIVESCM